MGIMQDSTLFRTPVETPPSLHPIQPHEGCVLLGSCFAQEMGRRMGDYGMDVLCNPLGTLYNPASIALLVRHALHPDREPLPVLEHEGEWRCWLAGTQVTGSSEEELRGAVTQKLETLRTALRHASRLIVTLGTNVCYRLTTDGSVVANCHKMPARLFCEDALTLPQCTDTLREMTDMLLEANPNLCITFTVSPYRYAKYGMHRSMLAKATLLLAVQEVCATQEQADYFPAFEILTDELRDYRFYTDDMLHPSCVAVDYIWQRFAQSHLSARARQYIEEYEPIRKGLAHRPSDPSSERHKAFVASLVERAKALREKYGMKAQASSHTAPTATPR